MLFYDHMRFDLLVVSNKYVFQMESGRFPRQQLDEVAKNPKVAGVAPFFLAGAKWQDPAGGVRADVTVLGVNPRDTVFDVADIERQRGLLQRPNTVLVDSQTRAIFGPLTVGRVVEIAGEKVTIGGQYVLGTGFLGLGIALAGEETFFRLFPMLPRGTVNLGLVTLKPGADPDGVARELRAILSNDTQIFTRPELTAHEVAFWTTRTATGLIFGSGLVVAVIVGIMVLYQNLATQITRHLPQFATLKAIGYSNRVLDGIVLVQSLLLTVIAFLPAFAAALGVYWIIRTQTLLPATMSETELGGVFVITLFMSAISAFISLGRLRRADPAEVF
jgi:putative ABC transport system permease protein